MEQATVRVVLSTASMLAHGLELLLKTQQDTELHVLSADEGRDPMTIARLEPDVVVMDLRGPADADVMRRLRTEYPDIAVVAVCAEDQQIHDALRSDAAAVVTESDPPRALASSVVCVAAGVRVFSPRAWQRIPVPPPDLIDRVARLDEDARRLLASLATGASYAELAAQERVSERTLKRRVARLQRELSVRSRVELAAIAGACGIAPLR